MKQSRSASAVKWAMSGLAVFSFSAQAAPFHFDDFESPLSSAYYWVETSDNDPTTPVVGQDWVVVETAAYSVQEVRHPQHLPGDPYPKFNSSLGFSTGPSFGPAPDGGTQYLHMWGSFSTPGVHGQAWAPISAADQADMVKFGTLELSTKVFGLSGHDFWRGHLRITGWDSPAPTVANPAFDVHLLDGGYGLDGTVYYRDGSGNHTIPGLVHRVNTWQDLSIKVDFATDTFELTLNGVTATGLTWAGGDLSKIQSVSLSLEDIASSALRGGYDNFSLTIPEPATAGLLCLVSGVWLLRRRRVSQNG
jgi:hypothetical protein